MAEPSPSLTGNVLVEWLHGPQLLPAAGKVRLRHSERMGASAFVVREGRIPWDGPIEEVRSFPSRAFPRSRLAELLRPVARFVVFLLDHAVPPPPSIIPFTGSASSQFPDIAEIWKPQSDCRDWSSSAEPPRTPPIPDIFDRQGGSARVR